jgi:hypothetical protein
VRRRYLQLSGRLGNQLFQWSYAHNLAKTFGEKIYLFTDKYHVPIKNDDEIKYFAECTHVGYVGQIDNLGRELKALDWLNTKNKMLSELLAKKLLWERTIDAYTAPKLPIGLQKFSGFYQDYQQVITVDDIIHSEIRNITDGFFMRLKAKNHLPNDFQFMHIRRGDLMTNSEVYGVLDLSWYLSNQNSDLPLLVSTDDMINSEGLIKSLKPDLVLNPKDFSALDTLSIMANSKDLVMANSTLSWWGGYLVSKTAGKVRFPNPYYKNNEQVVEKLCHPNFIKKNSRFMEKGSIE